MLRLLLVALLPLLLVQDCKCTTQDKEKGAAASAFQARYLSALAQRAAQCARADPEAQQATLPIHAFSSFDVQAAAAEGRMRYDAGKAEACLDYLRSAPCSIVPSLFDQRPTALACSEALAGAGAPGSICYHSAECQATGYCSATELRCPGACKAYVALGSSCTAEDLCAAEADCRCGDAGCAQHVCKPRAKAGERCETKEAPSCELGLYCVPNGAKGAGRCATQEIADACPVADACLSPARCLELQGPEHPGRCTLPKKVGEACLEGAHQCTDFASCIGGACRAWNRVGGACGGAGADKESARCIGGWCDLSAGTGGVGVCKAYRAAEAGCIGETFLDLECGPGRCDLLMHKCIYPCVAPKSD